MHFVYPTCTLSLVQLHTALCCKFSQISTDGLKSLVTGIITCGLKGRAYITLLKLETLPQTNECVWLANPLQTWEILTFKVKSGSDQIFSVSIWKILVRNCSISGILFWGLWVRFNFFRKIIKQKNQKVQFLWDPTIANNFFQFWDVLMFVKSPIFMLLSHIQVKDERERQSSCDCWSHFEIIPVLNQCLTKLLL